jgi:hypothetical protein
VSPDRLPDDFGFDDFLAALDAIDAPTDEDLATDGHGCVEVVTMPLGDATRSLSRLHDDGIVEAHLENDEEDDTAIVLVPRAFLSRARRVLGLAT